MKRILSALEAWFDSWSVEVDRDDPEAYRVGWLRVLPFATVHLACPGTPEDVQTPKRLGVFWAHIGWLR